MLLSSFPPDFIWVKITESVLDAEEDNLAVLTLPVENDLLPDSVVETPEHSTPRILQPFGRVGKVQVEVCGTREVFGPVARLRHLASLPARLVLRSEKIEKYTIQ